jgi:hypothetical protein
VGAGTCQADITQHATRTGADLYEIAGLQVTGEEGGDGEEGRVEAQFPGGKAHAGGLAGGARRGRSQEGPRPVAHKGVGIVADSLFGRGGQPGDVFRAEGDRVQPQPGEEGAIIVGLPHRAPGDLAEPLELEAASARAIEDRVLQQGARILCQPPQIGLRHAQCGDEVLQGAR